MVVAVNTHIVLAYLVRLNPYISDDWVSFSTFRLSIIWDFKRGMKLCCKEKKRQFIYHMPVTKFSQE
ncbi:hypothetical protein GcM3_03793 [Golovinomyces cichoracearum]|uniref:Uncharacterized protein n=1 Tax=Golovinomyces cichoracearum TaxID=62708 RepID=A0A420HD87_9PEZI|nr:hypothetical protein GcM3_03793 [Golovinomyces cichoracearum]